VGCKEYLDLTKSFVAQESKDLAKLKKKVCCFVDLVFVQDTSNLTYFQIAENFSWLNNYEYAWPLDIAIQATLKSSSAAAKRQE